MQFEEPLFHSPKRWLSFNLTGILYFPKLGSDLQIQKDKIQLYQNQVYVTDNVEGIVPEFLTMLKVLSILRYSIECISFWITSRCGKENLKLYRKVADKLKSLFTENRRFWEKMERYQNRFRIRNAFWRQVYEKSAAFVLYPTVDDKFYTLEELKENLKKTNW
jgi:molecular chaperone HtpG